MNCRNGITDFCAPAAFGISIGLLVSGFAMRAKVEDMAARIVKLEEAAVTAPAKTPAPQEDR